MAHVTIPDIAPRISYAVGATPTTGFAVPFPFFSTGDLRVWVNGVETEAFSVAGIAAEGGFQSGTITLNTAVTNSTVLLARDVPFQRQDDFPSGPTLNIPALNTALDRLTAFDQQIEALLGQTLRAPESETGLDALPSAAARANGFPAFDANGELVVVAAQPAGPGAAEAYWWGGTATGTGNAQVVTVASPPSAYADGQRFTWLAPAANTGAATVNINGLGAIAIRKGDGTTALSASDIPAAGAPVSVVIAGGGTVARLLNITSSVDLSAYAALAGTTPFSAAQVVATPAAAPVLTVRSTNSGASAASLDLDRNSPSPADDDSTFDLQFKGRDDTAVERTLSRLRNVLRDATAATAEGELQLAVLIAGVLTDALKLRNGLVVGGATGGFQGTGSVNATALFKNGAALPVQRMYDSGQQTVTAGGLLTLEHGLGAAPLFVLTDWECTAADAGWSIGDVWQHAPDFLYDGTASRMTVIYKDTTNVYVRYASSFFVPTKSTGNLTAGDVSKWRLRVRAFGP
jgi:hypothetical protein